MGYILIAYAMTWRHEMYVHRLDRELQIRGWTDQLPPAVIADALAPELAATPLTAALAIGALRRQLDLAEPLVVRRALRAGATWDALGWRLGRWPSSLWRAYRFAQDTSSEGAPR